MFCLATSMSSTAFAVINFCFHRACTDEFTHHFPRRKCCITSSSVCRCLVKYTHIQFRHVESWVYEHSSATFHVHILKEYILFNELQLWRRFYFSHITKIHNSISEMSHRAITLRNRYPLQSALMFCVGLLIIENAANRKI